MRCVLQSAVNVDVLWCTTNVSPMSCPPRIIVLDYCGERDSRDGAHLTFVDNMYSDICFAIFGCGWVALQGEGGERHE